MEAINERREGEAWCTHTAKLQRRQSEAVNEPRNARDPAGAVAAELIEDVFGSDDIPDFDADDA